MAECDGKRPYTTIREATKAATGRAPAAGYLRVYRCNFCGMFHLTSQKPNFVTKGAR